MQLVIEAIYWIRDGKVDGMETDETCINGISPPNEAIPRVLVIFNK